VPTHTYDKVPVARPDLIERARAIAAIARSRVEQAGLNPTQGITVLSLFDGIGCVGRALENLNIPVARYEAVDNDDDGMEATRIADHMRKPSAVFAGVSRTLPRDVNKINEQHIIDMGPIHLVAGGSPCKDLSRARMLPDRNGRPGRPGPGFKGKTGCLFPVKVQIIKWVLKHNPMCKYLAENSWFDHIPADWEWATRELGTPTRVDALQFSCTRRTRAFWTNIDLLPGWDTPAPAATRDPTTHLRAGWRSVGDRTITASWKGDPAAPYQDTTRPYMVVNDAGVLRYLDPEEAEGLIGLPVGCTAAPGVSAQQRLHGIGNGMDIPSLERILRCFRTNPVRREEQSVAAAMDLPWKLGVAPGDGKALLDVETIAPWLTAGPCPAGADRAGVAGLRGWDATATHPQATYLVSEWGHGVDVRYDGPRGHVDVCDNNPSFWTWPEESAAVVRKEVAAGRWLGPFILPPTETFLQTPLAMVEERDKFRHITNAKMGARLNEHITDPLEPMMLPTHAELQRRVRLLARRGSVAHVWMAKRDIRHAFRNVACRAADWGTAGIKVGGAYFLDTALNFGTRSSPDKFCELSDAVEWALRRWGVECVHYIDDFIFIGESELEVAEQVARFDIVMAAFGLPVKEEKDVGPAQQLEVLGVQYDFIAGDIAMPQRQLDKLRAGCTAMLAGSATLKAAESLLGTIVWAAQCMPHVQPFTSRIWQAVATAKASSHSNILVSQGLQEDLRWWQSALDAGLGAGGKSIMHTSRTIVHRAAGDAGTEWGVGGVDATHFYRACLPDAVRAQSLCVKRESSTFLELYNLLVMARVMGPRWKGAHVQVHVDNDILLRRLAKGRGKTPAESNMIREIYLLQVCGSWSWELQWMPRELNEAADALSKNDMPRFLSNVTGTRTELAVPPLALCLPTGREVMRPSDVRRAVCASGLGKEAQPARAIFMPTAPPEPSQLWSMLGTQVSHVTHQLPRAGHKTGVTKYLKLMERAGVPLRVGLPDTADAMAENLKRFMVDEVISYPVWHAKKAAMQPKGVVSANTACGYADHVSTYWAEQRGVSHAMAPHLQQDVRAFKEYLRRSLPHGSRQKLGITSVVLKDMVAHVRTAHGMGSVHEALMSLMWAGLLRPGEAVLTSRYNKFDISRHPAIQNLRFYCREDEVSPHNTTDTRAPDRFEFVVKYSKTDQRRLAAATVVAGVTHDSGLCPVVAMWNYLRARGAAPPTSPLFTLPTGRAVTYTTLRRTMDVTFRSMGWSAPERRQYAGHSFRIGAAQALALAGRSVEYVMAMGRWKCVESVMTYVTTPTQMRVLDVRDMMTATMDGACADQAAAAVFRARAGAISAASAHAAARLRSH
jgi:hypothetical protein